MISAAPKGCTVKMDPFEMLHNNRLRRPPFSRRCQSQFRNFLVETRIISVTPFIFSTFPKKITPTFPLLRPAGCTTKAYEHTILHDLSTKRRIIGFESLFSPLPLDQYFWAQTSDILTIGITIIL